jgi:hypothetical protein
VIVPAVAFTKELQFARRRKSRALSYYQKQPLRPPFHTPHPRRLVFALRLSHSLRVTVVQLSLPSFERVHLSL